mmetsp:Transcript_15298/g.46331  ORF Transcript_15298/g.46331 Transcript_15298/m.46331 type:complete len:243 (-) Transcript_15298:77-805(-)
MLGLVRDAVLDDVGGEAKVGEGSVGEGHAPGVGLVDEDQLVEGAVGDGVGGPRERVAAARGEGNGGPEGFDGVPLALQGERVRRPERDPLRGVRVVQYVLDPALALVAAQAAAHLLARRDRCAARRHEVDPPRRTAVGRKRIAERGDLVEHDLDGGVVHADAVVLRSHANHRVVVATPEVLAPQVPQRNRVPDERVQRRRRAQHVVVRIHRHVLRWSSLVVVQYSPTSTTMPRLVPGRHQLE